ncbi:MAG: hypothetical protein RLZZ598_1268 [Pseudomonadota bacterium]|jgi:hypothetical protein
MKRQQHLRAEPAERGAVLKLARIPRGDRPACPSGKGQT